MYVHPLIDEYGLNTYHKRLLLLLDSMGGEADLQQYVLEVLVKGWYKWDFYMYPVRLKDTILNPMSYELRDDLLYLEKKGFVEINGGKIKLLRKYYQA